MMEGGGGGSQRREVKGITKLGQLKKKIMALHQNF